MLVIFLLLGCGGCPCGVQAESVWLHDGGDPRRVDVDEDWGDLELDAAQQVWSVRAGGLFREEEEQGVDGLDGSADLVRAGEQVVVVDWQWGAGLAVRDPAAADAVTLLDDDPDLHDVLASGTAEGVAIAWTRASERDPAEDEAHLGWWDGGAFEQRYMLSGFQVDALSARGGAILLVASDDGGTQRALLGATIQGAWTEVALGEDVRSAELGEDGTIWVLRRGSGGSYQVEHLGLCTFQVDGAAADPALRPHAEGLDLYRMDDQAVAMRLRFGSDCSFLGASSLGPVPDTDATFDGVTESQGGVTAILGGSWVAAEENGAFDYWWGQGCK